jgi:hypothetical protein
MLRMRSVMSCTQEWGSRLGRVLLPHEGASWQVA